MIYYIEGKLTEVTPTYAVLDCAGVGYLVNITLSTYSNICAKPSVKLFTHAIYKEDSQTLFGFNAKSERDIFIQLISVSGVGGNTARVILSSLSSEEVISAISSENVRLLQSIKGIGAKTAQRIIIDLKDKVTGIETSITTMGAPAGVKVEAASALEVLGYTPKQTERLLVQLTGETPDAGVEEIIKQALKRL
ncbi:Holliday junction branch migration protein RuvA [Owenweeksia hongkongensis]|uniref:Holliday junction branch migration complex subunit RuvA n=1 Tax=Owenweeksia hongkongensis (strain DSM 17368 / CIP 108786 / JCM 12287 / NRRL B-23963 / UST20020801) TaxID=926562 RepID=G8R2A3_OWEHD|nr:Holliday junction branch migration protein RuvA [Owenweeksia hongkongensis]AEV32893.1 Holliday junction DNA helicase, RuvA subunit [Owenweeksia hongkongensis DSM 17368]